MDFSGPAFLFKKAMKIPTGGLLSPPNPQNRQSGNLTLDGKKRRFRTWKINQQHRQICEKKPAISVTSGKFWKYRIQTSTIFAKLKNFMQEEMVSSHFPPSIFPIATVEWCYGFFKSHPTRALHKPTWPQILCDVPWRRVTCGTFGVLSFRNPGAFREKSP